MQGMQTTLEARVTNRLIRLLTQARDSVADDLVRSKMTLRDEPNFRIVRQQNVDRLEALIAEIDTALLLK